MARRVFTVGIEVNQYHRELGVDPYEAEERIADALRRSSDGHGTDLETGAFDATWTYKTKRGGLNAVGTILRVEPRIIATICSSECPF
jgi:hypothetical protein